METNNIFIIEPEKLKIIKVSKLSEDKLSIITELKSINSIIYPKILFNNISSDKLNKIKNDISTTFGEENNNIIINENKNSNTNSNKTVLENKDNTSEKCYYQIFIYSTDNFNLLYHLKESELFEIKDYYSKIRDIALLNNQKELIIAKPLKLYIFTLINNNFIHSYTIDNPIHDTFNTKQSFKKIIIYNNNNFFVTNEILECSENPICLFRRNKNSAFDFLYSIYYGNEPEGYDVLILNKNKFIFQLNETYENNIGYFMIYSYNKDNDYYYDIYGSFDDNKEKGENFNLRKYDKNIIKIKGDELYVFDDDKVILKNDSEFSEFYIIDVNVEKIINHIIIKYRINRLLNYQGNFYGINEEGDIFFINMKIGKIKVKIKNMDDIDYLIDDILFFKNNKCIILYDKS